VDKSYRRTGQGDQRMNEHVHHEREIWGCVRSKKHWMPLEPIVWAGPKRLEGSREAVLVWSCRGSEEMSEGEERRDEARTEDQTAARR
jgi:hypothetical protein